MRRPIIILGLYVAATAIAGPSITAHISREDVREISATIHSATREPILAITPIYADRPVPGSIAISAIKVDGNGEREIKNYERTDRLSVRTGSDQNLTGGSYIVQKVGKKWKILSKGEWIH